MRIVNTSKKRSCQMSSTYSANCIPERADDKEDTANTISMRRPRVWSRLYVSKCFEWVLQQADTRTSRGLSLSSNGHSSLKGEQKAEW